MWLVVLVCPAFLMPFAGADPLPVAAGIDPVAYLVERIGGDRVSVTVLLASGQNPHTYEPLPRQVADLSAARVYFQTAMPFEKRLVEKLRASSGGPTVVDVCVGIVTRKMEDEDDHDHGAGAADPHVWLSPANGRTMAATICTGLKSADPANAAFYDRNLAALQNELDAVHERIMNALANYRGSAFYVNHPAFGYFADTYGLRQVSVEISGKEPTAKRLAQLVEQARRDRIGVVFLQQQAPKRAAESLAAEIGARVVKIDPVSRDYVANLEAIATALRESWQEPER